MKYLTNCIYFCSTLKCFSRYVIEWLIGLQCYYSSLNMIQILINTCLIFNKEYKIRLTVVRKELLLSKMMDVIIIDLTYNELPFWDRTVIKKVLLNEFSF